MRSEKNETIDDRLWHKAGQKGIPLTGAFELLPVCNFSCRMCYVRKSMAEVEASGGILPAAYWLDMAHQARDLGMLYPLLTGGEPLLHPEFREIEAAMVRMGMLVSINTNGSLIDRSMAKWLGEYRPRRINLTLYGASEESYERLCGNGEAFGRVLDAVQYLKEQEIPIKFNTSITPYNIGDLDDLIAFAKQQECLIQVATYMFPPLRRDDKLVGENDRLTPEEAGYARVRANYLQNEPEWFLSMAENFSRFVPIDQLPSLTQGVDAMQMQCRAGNSSLWFDWQGHLLNCGMYATTGIDMRTMSLREAWEICKQQTRAVRYVPRCASCPNRRLCHPCIAIVQNETGCHSGTPEYFCRMNQAVADNFRLHVEKYYPEAAVNLRAYRKGELQVGRDCESDL